MDNLILFTTENTKEIFNLLELCQGVRQDPEWHPEGDVFNHSLQVAKWAFRETNDIDLIYAALLHDVGKPINSHGHEKLGAKLAKGYVSQKTISLIENHMKIWVYLSGEMKKLSKCTTFAEYPYLPELIQLARWDKMGRKLTKIVYDKEKIICQLNKAANKHFYLPNDFNDIEKTMKAGGV